MNLNCISNKQSCKVRNTVAMGTAVVSLKRERVKSEEWCLLFRRILFILRLSGQLKKHVRAVLKTGM